MNGKQCKRLRRIARGLGDKFKVPEEETGTRIQDNARVRRDQRGLAQAVKASYKAQSQGGGDPFRIRLPQRLRIRRRPEPQVDPVSNNDGIPQTDRPAGDSGPDPVRANPVVRSAVARALVADHSPAREKPPSGQGPASDGSSGDPAG